MIIRTLELVPYLFWTKNWNIKLDTLVSILCFSMTCLAQNESVNNNTIIELLKEGFNTEEIQGLIEANTE